MPDKEYSYIDVINTGKNGKTDPLKTDEGDPWKTVQTVPRKTEEIDHLKTLQIAPPLVGA